MVIFFIIFLIISINIIFMRIRNMVFLNRVIVIGGVVRGNIFREGFNIRFML